MAVMLVAVWLFVFCMMIRALLTKRLLWPEKRQVDGDTGFNED